MMKKFLTNLLLVLMATQSLAQPASWGTPVGPRPESEALAQSVPIADVHMHYDFIRMSVDQMLLRMKESNVRWGGAVGDYSADLQSALGDKYISAIGQAEFTKVLLSSGEQGLQNVNHPVFVEFFKEAESLMATGKARGFGEIHINNRSSVSANDPFGRSIPLDSPVLLRMYEIANDHSGFVQIHYNKDFRTMCEISGATHIHGVKRIVTPDGINSRWLELIEAYPSRVMMGTDPCCGLMRRYGEIIQVMRSKALAAMKPETLENVAYKNAMRILGLKD